MSIHHVHIKIYKNRNMEKKAITVRMSDEDYQKIVMHAKRLGMGVSTFLRMKGIEE